MSGEAWGFGGVAVGGLLALIGNLVTGKWRHDDEAEERSADRLLSDATAATQAMQITFAEGRALYETVKSERDHAKTECERLTRENEALREQLRIARMEAP